MIAPGFCSPASWSSGWPTAVPGRGGAAHLQTAGVFDEGWWLGLTLIALAAWQPAGRLAPSTAESQRGWMIAVRSASGISRGHPRIWVCSAPSAQLRCSVALAALGAVAVRLVITYRLSLGLLERVRAESRLTRSPACPTHAPRQRARGRDGRRGVVDDAARAVRHGFKGYNDTFGHTGATRCSAVSGIPCLRRSATTATAYRLGGDEFCVVMPGRLSAVDRLLDAASRAFVGGRRRLLDHQHLGAPPASPHEATTWEDCAAHRRRAHVRVKQSGSLSAFVANHVARSGLTPIPRT